MIHNDWDKFYIPEPNSGCWIWTGEVHLNGYGKKGMYKAHRLFYEMQFGPIMNGMHVCHRCDTPLCVNPDHLWLGTHAENMRDKAAKGRVKNQTGLSNPNSKLTIDQVKIIMTSDKSSRALSKELGIDDGYIRRVRTGARWSTSGFRPVDYSKNRLRGENSPRAKLTNADVAAIRASLEPLRVLAQQYHVSAAYLGKIKKGEMR